MPDRAAVREFIAMWGPLLERAQATGVLARTKLDVRDQFEAAVAEEDDAQRSQSIRLFEQEIEAYCADMRLAAVTVQQQVERHTRRWLRGFLYGLLAAGCCAILALMIVAGAGNASASGAAAFGALLLFVGCPVVFFWVLFGASQPDEIKLGTPPVG